MFDAMRRVLALIGRYGPRVALAGLALIGGFVVGDALFAHETPADAPTVVVGTYDVPDGTLTVYGDHSARYVPASTATATRFDGMCGDFGPHAVTGEAVISCVPTHAPDGAPLVRLYEDGSATYANGQGFDPGSGSFDAAAPVAPVAPVAPASVVRAC